MKTSNYLLKNCLIIFLLFYFGKTLTAQYDYSSQDSTNQIKLYASISPVILAKDDLEIYMFNSLVSFWDGIYQYSNTLNDNFIVDRRRFTSMDHSLRVSYGFSKNRRWDLGATIQYRQIRLDNDARSSPIQVFNGDSSSGNSDRGVSSIGLQFRCMPFSRIPSITVQSSLNFPFAKNDDLKAALGTQRISFDLNTTWFYELFVQTYLFTQVGWSTRFKNEIKDNSTHHALGSIYLVKGIFNQKLYIFPSLTYFNSMEQFYKKGSLNQTNYQLLWGGGIQYQPNTQLSIFTQFQAPFILENGSGTSEWIKDSYTAFSLGFRILI